MVGAFKMAVFGVASPPVFKGSAVVCVKQTYYASKGLQIHANCSSYIQARLLIMEVRCLGWAHVLLLMVYDFMRRFLRETDEIPPFEIPQMRFVDAALACSQAGVERERDLFMLEERIDSSTDGNFRKYVNNRAATPLPLKAKADIWRAAFLCFTQHYQYYRTFKMVFVSDYQGGDSLLTDPQIMSSPALAESGKNLFADGNVSTGFASFETDHVCNEFCKFFKLPTDYANWEEETHSGKAMVASAVAGAATRYTIVIPSTAGLTKAMDISAAAPSMS
ncbi:hypothetical protein FB451DRAFT_1048909 [Mycena latifolia]|nr:hypothetical protein FB451DRAFT_1048909 [Mycena latifolia]